jgi:hypothetical protein
MRPLTPPKRNADMKTRTTTPMFVAHVLAALLLCADATAATPPINVPSPEAAFNDAMEQYRDGRWAAAYGRFAWLADHGHAEAARIALLMLRHGVRLYGHEWAASQPQISQWMRLAVQRMEQLRSESGD